MFRLCSLIITTYLAVTEVGSVRAASRAFDFSDSIPSILHPCLTLISLGHSDCDIKIGAEL